MMIGKLLGKLFGSRNERTLRRLSKIVARINALEPAMAALSDSELQAKTQEFRDRAGVGKEPLSQVRQQLDKLLPEAFAVVRETSKRVLNQRHFDVQLIGGLVLHEGKIAEMRTGEGKTLVATLPIYLNALAGEGVHLITVNDYLANRDAQWMAPIYTFLGMTVGTVLSNMSPAEKKQAYAADITYGTNNEFGFDYLRDNMAFSLTDRVQRRLYFAVIDEVDSILIDEARTPLIISGAAEDSSALYQRIDQLIPSLIANTDYVLDEKARQVNLTEEGHQHVEELMLKEQLMGEDESLYDVKNISLMHHVSAALKAHKLFHKDIDYIVHDNQIVIVDEHTGRTMPGRRWSDGIHQAVEAKEKIKIQQENQTLASITFQNYFRLYDKLAGMTGTADTEAYELQHIYGLEVVVIPTNKPIARKDHPDEIYLTANEKFNAIIKDIKFCQDKKQPVLVGTTSIEASEYLSRLLQKENISHQVLNAKYHEKEAQIIADAGRPGAVTIATNMAGRGTDIVLGGKENHLTQTDKSEWSKNHEAVLRVGGLHIIGSERHESRRIDNQLRGRAGRQGDPGSTRFYLSLEDNLMRIFAGERMKGIMQTLGMKDGEAIVSPLITRAIENAQRKVEGRNFDLRKQLLEYDDVANEQRKVIYEQRSEIMAQTDISETIHSIFPDVFSHVIDTYIPKDSLEEQWNITGLEMYLKEDFGLALPLSQWLEKDSHLHAENLKEKIIHTFQEFYAQKEQKIGADLLRQLEKSIMLQQLDFLWKDHLAQMDHLRQGIHLRGYAQKNPKQEYKREAFYLFTEMLEKLKYQVVSVLCLMNVESSVNPQIVDYLRVQMPELPLTAETVYDNVGRNDPCPCGSGKRYKQCHGVLKIN